MIDLHVHSIYSDGTDTPAALIRMAGLRGLAAMALTDHDTVSGIEPLLEAAEGSKVEAVPGIEMSAECKHGSMHILGYFIDPANKPLLEMIDRVQIGRNERNMEILKRLNKRGYVLMWSEVINEARKDVVGRPHFAEALVKRGYVKTRKAAFDLLLAKGRPAYVERYRYSAKICIETIRQAGGIAVLAHPATLCVPDDQLKGIIKGLKEYGLGGLETYYAEYRPDNIEKFFGWAKEYDLICTGGTDYHGRNTPDLKLGTGFGRLRVPDEVLDQLKAALVHN